MGLSPDFDREVESCARSLERGDAALVTGAIDSYGDLVHRTDEEGRTLLHLAIKHQDFLLTDKLIAAGARFEATTTTSATPMDFAAHFFPAAIPYHRIARLNSNRVMGGIRRLGLSKIRMICVL